MKKILVCTLFLCLFTSSVFAQQGGIENLRQTGKAFSSVAQQVSPSVVYIQVETIKEAGSSPFDFQSPFNDDMLKYFFGDQFKDQFQRQNPKKYKSVGQGSGFVFSLDKGLLSDKAYILTNNHVVKDADKVLVTFQNGKEFEAEVVGADAKSDIAVLKSKRMRFQL